MYVLCSIIIIITIIIIIIIKTSSTGISGINKSVYKLHTQPNKHLYQENRETNSGKQTTIDCNDLTFRCHTQCKEGHSTQESGPAGNTLQIGTFYTLILLTLMDELQSQLGYVEL